MKKIIFISLGFFFVFLGILGIILPLLPTTVFLIAASYFFMKSSPKLNERLTNNKYLGGYIKNFRGDNPFPLKAKISTIILLWASILFSSYILSESIAVRIVLLVVAIGVTLFILSFKKFKPRSVVK